jgi:hypothetical protein
MQKKLKNCKIRLCKRKKRKKNPGIEKGDLTEKPMLIGKQILRKKEFVINTRKNEKETRNFLHPLKKQIFC